ncbi:hypothetical protein [Actinoallomurus sp. NPDC050550]|uniref:hypothetical protein n=1 Tax=Actinoallomurus sp. NPDC050550 TaxID=3154937 RepID=UPI0033FAB123
MKWVIDVQAMTRSMIELPLSGGDFLRSMTPCRVSLGMPLVGGSARGRRGRHPLHAPEGAQRLGRG